MKIDGHYDREADTAWLRFEGYDPDRLVAEEVEAGLREIDPTTGLLAGLEYWQASQRLPRDLLAMLPPPEVPTAAVPRSSKPVTHPYAHSPSSVPADHRPDDASSAILCVEDPNPTR